MIDIEVMQGYLNQNKYVELSLWAKSIYEYIQNQLNSGQISNFGNLEQDSVDLFEALKNYNFESVFTQIEKLSFYPSKSVQFSQILKHFEDNRAEIIHQWDYFSSILSSSTANFSNLIIDEDIFIFKKDGNGDEGSLGNGEISLSEIFNQSANPDIMIIGGKKHKLCAMSSVEFLQGVLKNAKIKEQWDLFQKYEKIANFMDILTDKLQKVFSQNQIGFTIFDNSIYLIKWIQIFDSSTWLGNEVTQNSISNSRDNSNSGVQLIENFGVKIGVQLKEDLSFGNLVVFQNKNNKTDIKLRPLLEIDEKILVNQKKLKKEENNSGAEKKYDFNNDVDCKKFLRNITQKIEMGILLINQDTPVNTLKNTEDVEAYLNIMLQKIPKIASINQRIFNLRDLLELPGDLQIKEKIKKSLEANYIQFLKQNFSLNQNRNFATILEEFISLGLFKTNINILIEVVSNIISTNTIKSDFIIQIISLLEEKFTIDENQYKILEKPLIIALTDIVVQKVNEIQSADAQTIKNVIIEIPQFIKNFLKTHQRLQSHDIISLYLNVIVSIIQRNIRLHLTEFSYDSFHFMLLHFHDLLTSEHRKLQEDMKKNLKEQILYYFEIFSQDVDFVHFQNKNIILYLKFLMDFHSDYINDFKKSQMINNLIKVVPICQFRNDLTEIGTLFLDYLQEISFNSKAILTYITNIFMLTNSSVNKFNENPNFLIDITETLKKAFQTINISILPTLKSHTQQIYLRPLKKEVSTLISYWYDERKMPQNTILILESFLTKWAPLIQLDKQEQDIYINNIYIMELMWIAKEDPNSSDNREMRFLKKFENFSTSRPAIFSQNGELLKEELFSIMKQNFNDIHTFKMVSTILEIFFKSHDKLQVDESVLKKTLNAFSKNVKESLIHQIQNGDINVFTSIIKRFTNEIYFLPLSLLKDIISAFSEIHTFYETSEMERIHNRMKMLLEFKEYLDKTLVGYVENKKLLIAEGFDKKFISFKKDLLPLNDLIKDIYVKIGLKALQLYSDIGEKNILKRTASILEFIKKIISSILQTLYKKEDNHKELKNFVGELEDMIRNFFGNYLIFNINKKILFEIINEILTNQLQSEKRIKLFKQFIEEKLVILEEISQLESLDTYNDKTSIKIRIYKILESVKFFSKGWFLLAYFNLSREKNYEEAIKQYENAIQYNIKGSSIGKLYSNYLICYMMQGNFEGAVEIIRDLDVSLKTLPYMIKLIRDLERITGEELLPLSKE